MNILGVNSAYHESAACLVVDGKIVAAAEEERFNRVKHAKPARVDNPQVLPVQAIDFCLRTAGLRWDAIDHIGYSFEPGGRLRNTGINEPVVQGDWGSEIGETLFFERLQEVPRRLSALAGTDISDKFHWISHHMAHAASAFFVSPFDEAAVLVIDGIGEFESTTLYHGVGNQLALLKTIDYPHSLGFLWEKFSKFLGFSEYDAYKVMGLAAFGQPNVYRSVFDAIIHVGQCGFTIYGDRMRFRVEDYSALERLFGSKRAPDEELTPRHADIAAALQQVTEEALMAVISDLYARVGGATLCMAGGVALNCVANTMLHEDGPFDRIFIQPAAHDGGTAIGAAYAIENDLLRQPRSYVMTSPYLGPGFSDCEIQAALDAEPRLMYQHHTDIETIAARLIADGNVLGWFQGRMEIGPRALGNRSLLADPRRPDMQELMNVKVKHRECFRPFAPSVLVEQADAWFRIPKPTSGTDFMLFTYDVQDERRGMIPAVTHVDGTARIQTVSMDLNPRYYRLISAFGQLTGVPMLLNTSFNDSEPIVCTPQDALNTFLKTGIDYLAMGNFLVSKTAGGAA